MDISIIGPWFAAANTALTLGVGLYAIMTRGSKDNAQELKRLEKRLDDSERNIQAIQNDLKHLPDAQDVTDLKLAVTEMRGTIGIQAEVMSRVDRTVQRLDDYLREKAK